MKKSLIILIMATVVLAALTGCQREVVSQENGKGVKEVNTQFVFNIANSSAQTKQAASAVQEGDSPKFRGIVDARLMSYTLSNDGQILKADASPSRLYNLSQLVPADNGPRRVIEMSLPLQTNTLLLYGRAPKGTDVGDISAKDYYGYLDDYTISEAVGSGNFQLGKRLQDSDGFYAMEKVLAGILTVIMNTSMTTATDKQDISVDGFVVKKEDYPDLYWSMYYKQNGSTDTGKSPVNSELDRFPLEEKLGHLYKEMTTIFDNPTTKETELRAGSGVAILDMITDLWSVVNSIRCATSLSKEEAVAKIFATRVHNHLSYYFSATVPGNGGPVTDVAFKPIQEVGAHLIGGTIDSQAVAADIYWPDNDFATGKKPTSAEIEHLKSSENKKINTKFLPLSLNKFPDNFEIMHGAAYISFNAENYCFYYPEYFNTSAVGGIPEGDVTNGYSAESYYYPAELLYFGNSPIRTSSLDHKTADYPESVEDWVNDDKWAKQTSETTPKDDWKGTHVESTTHSVAMKYPIRYGVSMLETKVGYNAKVLEDGSMLDNNHAVQKREAGGTLPEESEPDKRVAVKDGSFKLVGVVIGGQTQNVGWDFLPMKAPGKDKMITGFIYDKAIASPSIPFGDGSTFTPNYTVVFDNYSESGYLARSEGNFGQDKVYVALEFQNCTGSAFYGNFNLIEEGGYFYLIGELDPAGKTVTWPNDGYVIPPYKYDGEGNYIGIPRVFIQDYKTTVTFKFGPNSLKYAYLTVPDLRASSLTLGLSVDIKWKPGITYNEVIIGGN